MKLGEFISDQKLYDNIFANKIWNLQKQLKY